MTPLQREQPRRILVRATNWVGDAVMTLPAVEALAQACPQAAIEVLAKPWVAPVYAASPWVSAVKHYDASGAHAGLRGRLRLAGELKSIGYDWAVLFQNAFEAALIARLAGIPVRLGYATDGRSLLLTHKAARTAQVRNIHETSYYLHILWQAGLLDSEPPAGGVRPSLELDSQDASWAQGFLAGEKIESGQPLLGLAPGATFGPAKCWPAERFVAAARDLAGEGTRAVLLFGSAAEKEATDAVAQGLEGLKVVDLAGRTSLGQALALLARLELFLTNDSGLMHAAAALGTPTVAVFGSTNPVTTAPLGPWVSIVRRPVDCSPCLKPVCPRDMRCFTAIEPQEVVRAGQELLASKAREGQA